MIDFPSWYAMASLSALSRFCSPVRNPPLFLTVRFSFLQSARVRNANIQPSSRLTALLLCPFRQLDGTGDFRVVADAVERRQAHLLPMAAQISAVVDEEGRIPVLIYLESLVLVSKCAELLGNASLVASDVRCGP